MFRCNRINEEEIGVVLYCIHAKYNADSAAYVFLRTKLRAIKLFLKVLIISNF